MEFNGETSSEEITDLLLSWGDGDKAALDRVIPLVYQELRRLAHRQMRRGRAGDVLQTTALINEAYLRLVDYARVRPRDGPLLRHCRSGYAQSPDRICSQPPFRETRQRSASMKSLWK